jgi:hypothetical protein
LRSCLWRASVRGAGNRRRCCQQQCSYQWQRRCQWQRTSASRFMATMSPSVLGGSRLVTCATRRPAGLCRDRQVLECARALRGQVCQAPRLSRSLGEAGRWACLASCRRRQVGQEAPPTATRWKPRRQRVTRAQHPSDLTGPGNRLGVRLGQFVGDGLDPSSTRSAVIGSSGSSRAAALDEEARVLPPSSGDRWSCSVAVLAGRVTKQSAETTS